MFPVLMTLAIFNVLYIVFAFIPDTTLGIIHKYVSILLEIIFVLSVNLCGSVEPCGRRIEYTDTLNGIQLDRERIFRVEYNQYPAWLSIGEVESSYTIEKRCLIEKED